MDTFPDCNAAIHGSMRAFLLALEFRVALLQKRLHSLCEITAGPRLILQLGFQIQLLLEGVLPGIPVRLANQRDGARPVRQTSMACKAAEMG